MIADALLDIKIGKIDEWQMFSVYLLFVFMIDLFKHPGGISRGGDTSPPHKQTNRHQTTTQTNKQNTAHHTNKQQ